MERDFRKQAGAEAEARALDYLVAKGLKLILRNYLCRGGEIDLVMLDGETLALIEVRSRSYEAFGGAAGSVDFRKQRSIVFAARHLLMTQPQLAKRRARFDVVAIARNDKLEWLKDAFRL